MKGDRRRFYARQLIEWADRVYGSDALEQSPDGEYTMSADDCEHHAAVITAASWLASGRALPQKRR